MKPIERVKLYSKIARKMHEEIMNIVHIYAQMVQNSDDLSRKEFQSAILYLSAHLMAGVCATYKVKDEPAIKKLLNTVVLKEIVKIIEENDIREIT